jgi:hypothetical protein
MIMTLADVAKKLKEESKSSVKLIYAFNGTGKTRLSKEFKSLIIADDTTGDDSDKKRKILYYNAFTEDLFYWDNDLENDSEPKLKIQPNEFTNWILNENTKEPAIIETFQKYSNDKLTPKFNPEYKNVDGKVVPAFSEVTFSFEKGNDEVAENIKISKGEESNFIWSVFYSVFESIVLDLIDNENKRLADESLDENSNSTTKKEDTDKFKSKFSDLEYIFIDDPVSSLDENHLIELAVNLAQLIKNSNDKKLNLKFIITTHNPFFYNVLHNELNSKSTYMLKKNEDGTYNLEGKNGDSNTSFSYHLYLKKVINEAIESNTVEKYHFTLLRNLYEKTASFLGYPRWAELLPDDKDVYYKRVIQFTSHSSLSTEAVAEPTEAEKKTVEFLLKHLTTSYKFWEDKK